MVKLRMDGHHLRIDVQVTLSYRVCMKIKHLWRPLVPLSSVPIIDVFSASVGQSSDKASVCWRGSRLQSLPGTFCLL